MTTTWLVRCGDGGRYIDDAVREGLITVDFGETSDVTGLPVEEIAVQLRVPAGTVKSRLARGRAALARLLDEHHPIEAKETDRGRP